MRTIIDGPKIDTNQSYYDATDAYYETVMLQGTAESNLHELFEYSDEDDGLDPAYADALLDRYVEVIEARVARWHAARRRAATTYTHTDKSTTPTIYDLWQAVEEHPDYIGGMVWTIRFVDRCAVRLGINADELCDALQKNSSGSLLLTSENRLEGCLFDAGDSEIETAAREIKAKQQGEI